MASELDVLLDKVEDPSLRVDLKRQVELLRSKRRFGLVFEEHLPERVQLPEHTIRRGTRVVVRDREDDDPREVTKVAKNVVTVSSVDGETEALRVDDLVVVADFGEPIYPGLRRLGSIAAGGDKPAQIVIKGENHHVLEALQFTHAGKVDCIYIDPPYNSGARDWKYGNDYVDKDDRYRHSKWLAFMERRLRLARQLLNPESSVLIVTIDEKEYLRLGLLLEQVFPDARIEMVSSVINPKGTEARDDFGRTNEYLFYVRLGRAPLTPRTDESAVGKEVTWETTRRRNLASRRGRKGKGACGPNQFYPIFVNQSTGAIVKRGDPVPPDVDWTTVVAPTGCDAVFPVRPNGIEMNWEYIPATFDRLWKAGFIRANGARPKQPQSHIIQHLPNKARKEIESGVAEVRGHRPDGAVIAVYADATTRTVTTQWNFDSHNAEQGGTNLLKALIPGRAFPFPKSLYAVEDALRIVLANRPTAVVLDFFAGSGTTAHAVARLNREDGGRRQSMCVTNNEVSDAEAETLRSQGRRPGDPQWEALGIFEHVTRPRIEAAVVGLTPEGQRIAGDYKFGDLFPIAEGLAENVEFFELTYLDPEDVEISAAYEGISPLLWLRAGGRGEMIEHDAPFYAVRETYGVLFNPDVWRSFIGDLHDDVRAVFIVTDSPSTFAAIAAELPVGVEAVRLYENYISTFTLNTRRTVPTEVEAG